MSSKSKLLVNSAFVSTIVLSSLGMSSSISAENQVTPVNVLTIQDESGERIAINQVNQLGNENKLVLFNDAFSYYTETSMGSKEVVLKKVGLNTYEVIKKTNGDSEIPEGGLVLSTGAKTLAEIEGFLNQLQNGETVTLLEPVAKIEHKKSNSVDPTKASNPDGAIYDGFRGPDQLIVYTSKFGDTTKTNQYGYEITVENGFVTKLGGGNSKIPQNGFVVSGHGIGANWLSSHSIIGAKVEVNEAGEVIITQNVESFAYQSQKAIEQAHASIKKAGEEFLDVEMKEAKEAADKAESLLKEAKAIQEENPLKALDLTRQATQLAYDAYYYSLPSHVAEQRAIWYRPEETTLAGVKQVLDRMEKAGFNSVYLETTFHGYTIYPSDTMKEYGLPAQHPRFQNGDYEKYGKDLLAAYIEEGKKRGLTIQAWTDGFMVGESSLGVPSQFSKYPEWAAIQRDNKSGKPAPDTASKYYWLDIAQPDVQTFMLDVYKEMQTKYDIKGLNIDYMRYPHHAPNQSYGFSTAVRELYKEKFGVDPYEIDSVTDKEEWNKWQEWLREKENLFVDKLHTQSKKIDKKFMMTATPEPGPEAVLISDWKDDIDGVIPQAYGHDFNSIQKTVTDSKKLMPEGTMYYTGIYSFYHHLSEMAAVDDVLSAKHGTSGVNMFAFGQASAPSVDALGKGPWREKAVNPGEEPLVASQVLLEEMMSSLHEIYIKEGAVNRKDGKNLEKQVKQIIKLLKKNPKAVDSAVRDGLDKINELVSQGKINETVGKRMKEDLEQVNMWVSYSLNHQQ